MRLRLLHWALLVGWVASWHAQPAVAQEAGTKVETPPDCLAAAGAAAPAVADGLGKVESAEPVDRKAGAAGLAAVAKAASDVARCLLRAESVVLRLRGVHALAAVRDASATATLVALLEDQAPRLRAGAAHALGALGPGAATAAVEPLIRKLGDADGSVQVAAAVALGLLGDRRAIEPLAALLGRPGPFDEAQVGVRAALVEDNGGQSVAVLDAAYKLLGLDPQATAALALEKLTKEKIGETPAKWQQWLEKRKKSR